MPHRPTRIAPGRPRSEDDDDFPTFFGIGQVQQLADTEPDEPPGVWLPMHRSGARFGGWQRRSIEAPARVIGFRRP